MMRPCLTTHVLCAVLASSMHRWRIIVSVARFKTRGSVRFQDSGANQIFFRTGQKWWSARSDPWGERFFSSVGLRYLLARGARLTNRSAAANSPFVVIARSSLLTGAADAPRGTWERAGNAPERSRVSLEFRWRSRRASDDGVSAGPRPGLAMGVHHRGRSPRRGLRGLAVAGGVHPSQGADGDEAGDGAQVVLPSFPTRPTRDGAPPRRPPRVLGRRGRARQPRARGANARRLKSSRRSSRRASPSARRCAARTAARVRRRAAIPSDSSSPEALAPTTTRDLHQAHAPPTRDGMPHGAPQIARPTRQARGRRSRCRSRRRRNEGGPAVIAGAPAAAAAADSASPRGILARSGRCPGAAPTRRASPDEASDISDDGTAKSQKKTTHRSLGGGRERRWRRG